MAVRWLEALAAHVRIGLAWLVLLRSPCPRHSEPPVPVQGQNLSSWTVNIAAASEQKHHQGTTRVVPDVAPAKGPQKSAPVVKVPGILARRLGILWLPPPLDQALISLLNLHAALRAAPGSQLHARLAVWTQTSL